MTPTSEWHTRSVEEVLAALSSSPAGLSEAEAAERLSRHGPNELKEGGGRSPLRLLLAQFGETMVLILLAAALVSGLLGKQTETVAILAIVLLFAGLGFVQEYRAERAMAALRRLAVPTVRVRRDGAVREGSARELVPGDVVLLEAGAAVPADLRFLESVNLRVQEAALTGESEAVEKTVEPLAGSDLPLGDRRNLAFLGTAVTYGRGSAVVTATGMETELGRIAALIQGVRAEPTPLQRKLDGVGKALASAGAAAALLVLGIGLLRGEPWGDMLRTGISVAVAVVPEGLPAVVTIALSMGARRMLRRQALIRKLPAVETLGSVTVICSDKTGTLTENRMTVTVVDVAGDRVELQEVLRHRQPVLDAPSGADGAPRAVLPAIREVLEAGALCNDAVFAPDARPGSLRVLGDPTEGALLVAAMKAGLDLAALQADRPRVGELPFDSGRKRMTTVHRGPDGRRTAYTKGAVDGLLELSVRVRAAGSEEPMSEVWRARIRAANDELAAAGMRVLGLARRPLEGTAPAGDGHLELERELTFLGLVGMMDPPRAAVRPAVQTCLEAGIRPVMITGDHPLTALAIARDLGIGAGEGTVTGEALARLGEAELDGVAARTSVYARVSPEDKLRIVQALQRRGEVVAMTGDGVNDSPALKKADIGVAMGITGTDVAKEAADMVLLDDNFATIVAAVEEGRVIYGNLVRFVKFSLGGNVGKVLVMLGAPLLGVNVALRPLPLLWLNLITDGLLGLGLSLEPGEPDTMRRPPRSPAAPILDRPSRVHVGWVGALIGALTLALGAVHLDEVWQTMVFATLGFTQVGHALGLRSAGRFPFSLRSNPAMTLLVLTAVGLQLAAIYLPPLERFFGLPPLPAGDLLIAMGMGVVTFAAVRLERLLAGRHAAAYRGAGA